MPRPFKCECTRCGRITFHESAVECHCPYCDPTGMAALLGGEMHNYRRVHYSEEEFAEIQERLAESREGGTVEVIPEGRPSTRRRKWRNRRNRHSRND